MIYATLFAAFAASAFGACKNDVTAPACRTFNADTNFAVTNAPGSSNVYDIKVDLDYNDALQTVTTTPWNKLSGGAAAPFGQATSGCVYSASLAGPASLGTYQCSQNVINACDAANDGKVGTTNRIALGPLVAGLNTQGSYELYFQRVQENPIGLDLKWIAENACKVTMPVSFECTGADCVEVQNIVCASFAGIDATNHGVVSMECKVPPSFTIRHSVGGPANGRFNVNNNNAATNGAPVANHFGVYGVSLNPVAGVGQPNPPQQVCANGKCQITLTSPGAIGAGETWTGDITADAEIQSLQMTGQPWSGKLDRFHTANYDLSRKSAPPQVLSMPIGVNFHSDENTPAGANLAALDALFPQGLDSVPFLATQRVDLGQIVKHNNGFLRIIAKVAAANHWFLSKAVSAFEVDDGSGAGFANVAHQCVDHADVTFAVNMNLAAGTTHAGPNGNWPKAYIKCPGIMANINAGDVMRFSLQWQLANTIPNAAGVSGKAALLQDADQADPNAQSVEVQLTIQLGGGETNITTGAADGAASADNTVTYIIIAVCVIAAALILAVVVVAFMCLRNRSQEQMVSMSPQKCTVAAVYDISAPKKADAMDV